MAHRNFSDGQGTRWEVWAVIPTTMERRVRQQVPLPVPNDRRKRHESRLPVPPELQKGWLTFQSRVERRRLAPAPTGWESMSDEELTTLLGQAAPRGKPRRLIE